MPRLGSVRARCKQDFCVVEFNRVDTSTHERAVKLVEKLGFEVVAVAVDEKGDPQYAADVRFRVPKHLRSSLRR